MNFSLFLCLSKMDKIDMNIQENVATFITKLPKVILLCVIIYLISLNFKTTNEIR